MMERGVGTDGGGC